MTEESKKLALMALWLSAALVLLAAVGWITYDFYRFPIYHDTQYRFSIKYPREWKKLEKFGGVVVSFSRLQQTALDIFKPNANISVRETPIHLTSLASFSQVVIKQVTTVFGKTMSIVEDKDCTFANRAGHRLVLFSEQDQLKVEFVWTIKGPVAYIFTFMARDKDFKELSGLKNTMIKSFKFD